MTIQYRYSGSDNDFPRAASVITLVQSTCALTAGPTTTASVTLPSVIAGHLMVVSVRYGSVGGLGSTTTSVSDGTTTFTPLTEKTISNGSGFSTEARLFYLLSSNASGGTATFTVTLGAVRTNVVICVWDFSSTQTFAFDIEAGSTGTSAAPSSGSLATTGTNEVVVAQLGTILTAGTGDTPSSPLINGSPADASNTAAAGDMAWEKVFLATFTGSASATLSASDSWALAAAGFKTLASAGALDDGGWTPFLTIGNAGAVTIGPSIWQDGNWEGPIAQPASLAGGDGNINDITAKLWPVPPSQIPPWIGEQDERPTPAVVNIVEEDLDVLALLRAPVIPAPATRAPFAQQDDDLPLNTANDDGGWVPFFSQGATGSVTVDPSSWYTEDIVPGVQPTAPPVEEWDPFRLMGLPVPVPPPSRGPDFWTLDELIGNPPVDDGTYDLPVHFVQVPGPSRPMDWSWVNQLVPTAQVAPATDEPGTLDWLLRVAEPVYTVFDRNFLFDLDQDFPILVPVVPEIVDSPTRLLVLNYQSTLLLVLDENGNPMAQPLIITQGEAGPLSLACAGANHDRQTLTDTTVTLRLVSEGGVVYANAVPLTIVSATDGVVLWNRLPAQVQDPGDYHYQVKVLFTDGTFKFFPDANPRKGNPLEILEAV